MKYAYEDLSDDQFERLVVLLCQRLLGISVQGFAKGPDGGRDAKFVGVAELLPSKAAPWRGTVIIQAKHTNGFNRSFSETDFFNPESGNNILGEEIPKIKRLHQQGQCDHYMLFANRRLSGNAESEIRKFISTQSGIPGESIYLCGVEQLELWFRTFSDVPKLADLDPIDSPLIVSSEDLAEVVEALGQVWTAMQPANDDPPVPRVTYEKKNKLNHMTPEYAKEQRNRYLKHTAQIRAFLAAPENSELLGLYESVADEFQLKIVANRKDFQTFDKVMEYIADMLFNRDAVLRQRKHKRLTRAVLFYMYWNCDIGEVGDDVATN